MSCNHNELIKEGLFDMALEMSTTQLADSLGLEIDALSTKDFADTSGAVKDKEILFTGFDIFTHDDLCGQQADEWFDLKFA
jgi:hypothetical protein|tara:strand:+ start:3851 stop:4093 length:243 start_codon:yes stop_codon:yes gene_type:complete